MAFLMIPGKSLYVKRLHEKLRAEQPDCTELLKTIRLIEPEIDEDKVLKSLLPFLKRKHQTKPMIFHFDITSSVSTSSSGCLVQKFCVDPCTNYFFKAFFS